VAYDEDLATRLRKMLADQPGLVEKRMFGGLAFLLNGNMACGVHGDELIVRTEPSAQQELLARPGAHQFDLTGRPMKGWLLVGGEACATDRVLRQWVNRGITYARSLPPK
jgi:TfoX/Sxy family transcriptional regulator of competence genes